MHTTSFSFDKCFIFKQKIIRETSTLWSTLEKKVCNPKLLMILYSFCVYDSNSSYCSDRTFSAVVVLGEFSIEMTWCFIFS